MLEKGGGRGLIQVTDDGEPAIAKEGQRSVYIEEILILPRWHCICPTYGICTVQRARLDIMGVTKANLLYSANQKGSSES